MFRCRLPERMSSPGPSVYAKLLSITADRRLLLCALIIFFLAAATVCLQRTTPPRSRVAHGGGPKLQALAHLRRYTRPLSDRASNVRLCSPDTEKPFTTGTFLSRPLPTAAGNGTEHKLAQVTLFEAELLHLAWEDKPEIFASGRQGGVAPVLRLLAAVEDSDSIHRSQFHGWGAAFMSPLYFNGNIQLECHYYPTAGASGGAGEAAFRWGAEAGSGLEAPVFKSLAFFERMGSSLHEYYVILLCPAPAPAPAPTSPSEEIPGEGSVNGNSSKEGQRGAGTSTSDRKLLGEDGAGARPGTGAGTVAGAGAKGSVRAEALSDGVDRVLYEGRFEVQLAASLEGSDLRISRLHLCRSDRDSIPKPFHVLLGQDIAVAGEPSEPLWGMRPGAGAGEGEGEGGEQQLRGAEGPWVPGASLHQLPSLGVSGHGVYDTLHYLPRGKGGATRVLVDREEVQVAASEAVELAGKMPGSRAEAGREFQLSVCVRPFASARPFMSETGSPTSSDARIVEWIDAHLLAGVDHIYFFDRDPGKRRRLLRPYVRRGQLLHLPFPDWSEVHFRLEYKKSGDTYNFPTAYDQIPAYELCLMLGRRYGDTWQFHTDLDEFLLTPHPERGSLKRRLTRAVAAEEAARGHRVKVLSIQRFDVWGVTAANRLMPVLPHTKRNREPLHGGRGKLAVSPEVSIPSTSCIHVSNVDNKFVYTIPVDLFRIYHYTSWAIDANWTVGDGAQFVKDVNATKLTSKVARRGHK
eukprot:jgi/Mesen1/9626/ME000669S09062